MVGTFKPAAQATFVESCTRLGFADEIFDVGGLLLIKP